MKRILLIDRFFFPDEQATSIYLTELTAALGARFCFEILCGPPALITERGNSVHPVKIHQVFSLNFPKRLLFARFLNDLSFLLSAFCCGLTLSRPNLIVSQTSPPGIWWVAFLLSLWHRVPWVHVCQDLFPDNLKAFSHRNGKLPSWFEQANTSILKQSKKLVALGRDMEDHLATKGFDGALLRQISNWVDLDFIRPFPRKNSFSEKNGLVNKFVILYAGNLGRIYNFEDALEAARALRNYPKVVFVFVGEGALKEKLMQDVRNWELGNITLLPFEPRYRVPEVLASADVHLIFLKKGMAGLSVPSKIYSALASGRPTIACVEEESEIARLVRESNSGFVVPPGKPDEFAQAILRLYEDKELREKFGRNARAYAEAQDFQNTAFRDYEKLFEEVLAEG